MAALFTGLVVWVQAGEVEPDLCVLPLTLLFLSAAAFFSIRQLIFPDEWELVVDGSSIRWGPTDRPDRQDRLRLAEVKRWIIHRFDRELFADTGCLILKPVGQCILSIDDIDALLAFLKERHANVCVVDSAKKDQQP